MFCARCGTQIDDTATFYQKCGAKIEQGQDANNVMLDRTLDDALGRADIVILNGGSSKGGEDHNARLLHDRGRVLCHGVAAAPGRPLCAAMVEGKPSNRFIGLFQT